MDKEAAHILGAQNSSACLPHVSTIRQMLPLSLVRAGEHVQIKSVSGKAETKHYLCNLGFVEGAEVVVISEMDGNVIVNIKGTRMAIGKGMATHVLTN